MTNKPQPMEKVFPKFDTFNNLAKQDKRTFHPHFQSDVREMFDQSKWEDRMLMFAHIMYRTTLQNDPRPPHHKWMREQIAKIDQLVSDGKGTDEIIALLVSDWGGFALPEYLKSSFKKLLEQWESKTLTFKTCDFFHTSMCAYQHLYPENMVKKTSIGSFCFEQIEKHISKEKKVKECIDNHTFSLVSTIEQMYSRTMSLKEEKGDDLWLHKGDIDWKSLLTIRWKIELLNWWYQEYVNGLCFGDVTEISYTGNNTYDSSYVIDYCLYQLFKAYGVNWNEYIPHTWGSMLPRWCCQDDVAMVEEYDVFEDQLEDGWKDTHKYWKEKYGLLEE